tara:strand:+ start:952 stop:1104 length:153 start_codon:yes stop_codon:yes gene_type:complete
MYTLWFQKRTIMRTRTVIIIMTPTILQKGSSSGGSNKIAVEDYLGLNSRK